MAVGRGKGAGRVLAMTLHRKVSFSLVFIGFVLALVSWTDLCSFGGCTEAHQYRLFGMPLPLIGTIYFCVLSLLMLFSKKIPLLAFAMNMTLAGGAGAELVMIHLQKNVIQAWCPLCIGIAAVVFLLCIMNSVATVAESWRSDNMNIRNLLSRSALMLVCLVTGFAVSFVGIKKPEAAGADATLGKSGAKVEVYVFSDWLCPICVKVEPAIEEAYKALDKKVRFHFIDKVVHQESMNFVPYHLSFLVNEKTKYMQIRKGLFDLAKVNKNPTLQDVQAVVGPLGVTYKQLSFMDVTQAMSKAQALSNEYKVSGTPTIVVLNSASKKSKTLVGGKDITAENLIKTVKGLE